MRDEALKLALEALMEHEGNCELGKEGVDRHVKAITAIKQALAAQPAQEPVAWFENLKRLASICPELNMVNYSDEDVDDLNCWAIEVATCIYGIATPPAQPVQKPIGYVKEIDTPFGDKLKPVLTVAVPVGSKLYTTPPQLKPLTDEEMQRMAKRIEELEAMLEQQTARIVDLQTHIANLEGE